VTFNVDDVLTDESISEKEPLPPAEMPHDQDDSPTEEQQLRKEIDEMKKNFDQYLSDRLRAREIAKKELEASSNNLSDAEKAKLTATINGVSEPTRKRDGGKPTDHGFRSDDHYDWCRLKHIMKLIKSEAALSVPLFAGRRAVCSCAAYCSSYRLTCSLGKPLCHTIQWYQRSLQYSLW